MTAESLWEMVRWLLVPLGVAWVGYMHKEHIDLRTRMDTLRVAQSDHEAANARSFVTKDDMHRLESRLMTQLDKMDNKLTSIYERK